MAPYRYGNPGRVKVLFDANALMMPAQFGIDLFGETEGLVGSFEPITLEEIKDELSGIAKGRGRNASAARVALAFAGKCTIERSGDDRHMPVDERIVRFAGTHHCTVVTNDRLLRKRLLDQGIDVIVMRKQEKLEILKA